MEVEQTDPDPIPDLDPMPGFKWLCLRVSQHSHRGAVGYPWWFILLPGITILDLTTSYEIQNGGTQIMEEFDTILDLIGFVKFKMVVPSLGTLLDLMRSAGS